MPDPIDQTGAAAAGQQSGVSQGQAAAGQGQQPSSGGTSQGSTSPEIPQDLQGSITRNERGEQFIPLQAVLDERGKRQGLEKRLGQLEEQLYLYRLNPPQMTQGAPPAQGQGATQGQAQPEAGDLPEFLSKMEDSEVINAGELKQALKGWRGGTDPTVSEQSLETVGEHILLAVKPDAEHVLMGSFRQRLMQEPHLVNFVKNAHPMLRPFIAYRLGMGQTGQQAQMGAHADFRNQTAQGAGVPGGTQDVQAMLNNLDKPTATSKLAGGGTPLDAASRWASMDDDAFEAEIQRVKRGA